MCEIVKAYQSSNLPEPAYFRIQLEVCLRHQDVGPIYHVSSITLVDYSEVEQRKTTDTFSMLSLPDAEAMLERTLLAAHAGGHAMVEVEEK